MAKKRQAHKTYGIRTNVILGFTIAFSAVVLAGYLAYDSTNKLLFSVIELSKTDQKLPKLREVFNDLTEAENNMRMYALVKEQELFDTYLDHVFRANRNIDTLKMITADHEEHHRKVRQISILLNTRLRSIEDFMVIKQTSDTVSLAWRALERLKNTPPDTTRTSVFTRTSVTTSQIDTLQLQPAPPPDEKPQQSKGFFGRLADLFSGKPAEEQVIIRSPEKVLQETTIVRDTSVLVETDTLMMFRIQTVLTELKEEEARRRKRLFDKELELLQNNSMIIRQIMDVIAGLEREEVAIISKQTADARAVAAQSVMVISTVILGSLFIVLIFLFLILRAISRSNYFRNQLVIAKQKAEQLAKAKEEFLAIMSHEIRTPLNAIIGFSELLSRTKLSESQNEHLGAVKVSSEHLLSLVNDILDFSKIEQGKLKIEITPFTIRDVFGETIRTFIVRADEKGIRLKSHVEFDDEMALIGDPLRLKQVLFNLVGNAVKFTEEGKVFLLCRKVSDPLVADYRIRLRFEVHDTGIGIHADKLEAIFEGFTQADSSLSRRFGGTGLGLTISKKLVEMQGGVIGVNSEEGKGSVFYFELPYALALSDEPSLSVVDYPQPSVLLKDKRILLVDDDEFNIRLTMMMLERWAVIADKATNGKSAIALIQKNEYDLVLTDIHMPDMNGLELTQIIRAMKDINKASVPIVAITANVIKDELEHFMKAGMDDYLLKPYRENDLFAKIADQLGFDYVPQPRENEKQSRKDSKAKFDLKDVKRFSGGNKKAMAVILKSFINENRKNLDLLQSALDEKNYFVIAGTAHKMLTSYGHLGITSISEELRQLEALDSGSDHEKVSKLVERVLVESAGLFPFIQLKAAELEGQAA